MLKSGPLYRAHDERRTGGGPTGGVRRRGGISDAIIGELLTLGATPTLESMSHTFARLYFDRVVATPRARGRARSLKRSDDVAPRSRGSQRGALVMGLSWARGHDRYSGLVAERSPRAPPPSRGRGGEARRLRSHARRRARGWLCEHREFRVPEERAGPAFPRDRGHRRYAASRASLLAEGVVASSAGSTSRVSRESLFDDRKRHNRGRGIERIVITAERRARILTRASARSTTLAPPHARTHETTAPRVDAGRSRRIAIATARDAALEIEPPTHRG